MKTSIKIIFCTSIVLFCHCAEHSIGPKDNIDSFQEDDIAVKTVEYPKPKVAVGFWGLTRSLSYTIDHIQQHIYKPLQEENIDYDIYLHTYQFSGKYSNPYTCESDIDLDFSQFLLLEANQHLIDDQDAFDQNLQLDDYKEQPDPWRNNYVSLHNHLRALYSLQQLITLIENSNQNYEVVILLRPDLYYLNDLPIETILSCKENTLYISPYDWDDGISDRFGFGSWDVMRTYGTRYQHALEYSRIKPLLSERFLKDHMMNHQIEIATVPFFFQRVRANGEKTDPYAVTLWQQWQNALTE